jgi:hypothetical protein
MNSLSSNASYPMKTFSKPQSCTEELKKVDQDLNGLEVKYVIQITSSRPKEENDDVC